MSDTLQEELRDLACEWVECCGDIHLPLTKAADRIEELEAERGEALNQLNSALHSVEVLEVNVARMREALYRIQDGSYGKNAAIARTALAELKGENQ